MSNEDSAIYSPYGAYELKSKYQRNFVLGTLMTAGFVVSILLVFWIASMMEGEQIVVGGPAMVIETVADLGPPPTIAKRPPQVQVNQPNVAAPKVGIPTPVADDEVIDEDVTIATREEMAEIIAPDITSTTDDVGDIVVDIADDDYLPSADEFVPVEIVAEMVYYETPDYPRLARQAGLEGVVWVKALVSRDGDVLDAQVGKTSGNPSLDEAALDAAPKCKFKPAIQNDRPVAMWVTYRVEFVIDN